MQALCRMVNDLGKVRNLETLNFSNIPNINFSHKGIYKTFLYRKIYSCTNILKLADINIMFLKVSSKTLLMSNLQQIVWPKQQNFLSSSNLFS